jgi:putative transposase
LWEGRYRATVLDTKPYLLTCCRYIELNPVRAGLTKSPGDYRWSSYRHNAQGEFDEMITPHREYLKLGKDEKQRARAYRALFRKRIDSETVEYITESTLKGWAIGDPKFARRMEKRSGRRAMQLPKGRPRGS